MLIALVFSAYYVYMHRGSGGVESKGTLKPVESLKTLVGSVESLSYTMSMVNETYSDSYTVTYRLAGEENGLSIIEIHVSKPEMNITLRVDRENGTVSRVDIDNGTSTTSYNETMASYVGFNVLKDALMPLVNPTVMSQIIDWSTMTSLDDNFEIKLLGKRLVSVSGKKYTAYTLLITQPSTASKPIQGFLNMTYMVLDWKGTPVVYEMKVHRAEGVVTMHLDSFKPSS